MFERAFIARLLSQEEFIIMRTAAREAAFKTVFASRFTGGLDGNLASAFKKSDNLDGDDENYLVRVLGIISSHENDFLQLVDKHSKSFPESRLYPADKSILLVALAEIKYMDDIPEAVSINEAANIASKYSSAKSASFISGILSEIVRD